MKSHLLLLNGPEKRDFIVEKCLKVCVPHFDAVAIVQSGKIPNHTNPIIERFTIHSTDDFIPFIEAYNILASTVAIGDRFLVLDSDEIPTKKLIEFVTSGDWAEANMLAVSYFHHHTSNDGDVYHITDSKDEFAPYRGFIKEDGLYAKTYEGGHQMFFNKEQRPIRAIGHINHMKHDFALLTSFLAYTLSIPKSQPISIDDIAMIEEIRNKFGITPSFVYKNFSNKMLMKELSLKLSGLHNKQVGEAFDFIITTNRDLAELYRYNECLGKCCKYE